mmetsp:Transcript_24284/g.27161  ORF Transcript_24284/g.27161 Transcript_24284/m.27161 type:complete len:83 (-) Transcript_24284:3437-3685(-)
MICVSENQCSFDGSTAARKIAFAETQDIQNPIYFLHTEEFGNKFYRKNGVLLESESKFAPSLHVRNHDLCIVQSISLTRDTV